MKTIDLSEVDLTTLPPATPVEGHEEVKVDLIIMPGDENGQLNLICSRNDSVNDDEDAVLGTIWTRDLPNVVLSPNQCHRGSCADELELIDNWMVYSVSEDHRATMEGGSVHFAVKILGKQYEATIPPLKS